MWRRVFVFSALVWAGIFCLANFYAFAEAPKVIISEIAWMGSADSANSEWLELKNTTDEPIDLSGWTLSAQDLSPNIALSGIISGQGYFLLERTSDDSVPIVLADQIYTGALGNTGEILELKDSGGNLIDSVDASAGWPNGNNETKKTMERNLADFSWQTSVDIGGTPKAENSSGEQIDDTNNDDNNLPPENATSTPTSTPALFQPSQVVINEFVADPSEGEKEWFELFNNTNSAIDLAGWSAEDGVGKILSLEGQIAAKSFLVFEIESSKLNNSGDIIILKDNAGQIIDSVTFGNWDDGDVSENASNHDKGEAVARKVDGQDSDDDIVDFALTITPTKSVTNQITSRPTPPPSSSGGGNNNLPVVPAPVLISTHDYSLDKIIISEVFPNPAGVDSDDEFIELKNIGDSEVDLTNWILKDNTKSQYKIFCREESSCSAIIKPNNFLAFKRSDTKIALNNTGEEKVFLISPDAKEKDAVQYSGPVGEDQSYSRDDKGEWQWTGEPTFDGENIFENKNLTPQAVIGISQEQAGINEWIEFDASDSVSPKGGVLKYQWDFGDGKKSSRQIVKHRYSQAGEYQTTLTVTNSSNLKSEDHISIFIEADEAENETPTKSVGNSSSVKAKTGGVVMAGLEKIRELSVGQKIKTSGVVAVEPGILGSQIFYLDGVQVYSYKKDFPSLKPGDLVEVSGELSEAGGERRIKIVASSDIKLLDKKDSASPLEISTGEIDEAIEGRLVKASGEVLEVKGSYIYLDDGSGEARIYFKSSAGIDFGSVKAGDFLTVTGLVSQTSAGYRILPRYQSDIAKGEVKGAATENSSPLIKGKLEGVNKYLIAILIFLFLIVIWLAWQNRKLKKSGWRILEE